MEIDPCADCGICCKAFSIAIPVSDSKEFKDDEPRLFKWMTEDIIPLSKEEVLALNIIEKSAVIRTIDAGKQGYYTCRFYDKITKRCNDYDNRPYVCSDFPNEDRCSKPYLVGCGLAKQKFTQTEIAYDNN